MSSVSHKGTIDKIIAENGKGNPPVVEILTYENIFNGGLTYKLIYKGEDAEYIYRNLAGNNIKSLWKRA